MRRSIGLAVGSLLVALALAGCDFSSGPGPTQRTPPPTGAAPDGVLFLPPVLWTELDCGDFFRRLHVDDLAPGLRLSRDLDQGPTPESAAREQLGIGRCSELQTGGAAAVDVSVWDGGAGFLPPASEGVRYDRVDASSRVACSDGAVPSCTADYLDGRDWVHLTFRGGPAETREAAVARADGLHDEAADYLSAVQRRAAWSVPDGVWSPPATCAALDPGGAVASAVRVKLTVLEERFRHNDAFDASAFAQAGLLECGWSDASAPGQARFAASILPGGEWTLPEVAADGGVRVDVPGAELGLLDCTQVCTLDTYADNGWIRMQGSFADRQRLRAAAGAVLALLRG